MKGAESPAYLKNKHNLITLDNTLKMSEVKLRSQKEFIVIFQVHLANESKTKKLV